MRYFTPEAALGLLLLGLFVGGLLAVFIFREVIDTTREENKEVTKESVVAAMGLVGSLSLLGLVFAMLVMVENRLLTALITIALAGVLVLVFFAGRKYKREVLDVSLEVSMEVGRESIEKSRLESQARADAVAAETDGIAVPEDDATGDERTEHN